MNRKLLLLAILMIVGAWGKTYAQEDISDVLTNPGLSSLDGWTQNGYTAWKTDGAVPVIEFWNWSTEFSFSQTVTLPAGEYRLAVNSFYRDGWDGNGTNNNMAWIFANETKKNVVALNSMADLSGYSGSNDLYRAATAFSQGKFSNEFDFTVTDDNTEVTLGFKGTTPGGGWCILGPVKLYKYSLEAYLVDYRTKVAAAKALYDQPMNADALTALQNAVVEESTFSLSSEVTAAIDNLTQKIAAAETSIQNYKDALDVINAANALTSAGQEDYAASAIIQEIQGAYDARTLVSLTAEQKAAAKEALTKAVLKQTEVGAIFTSAAPTTWEGQSGAYQGTRPERFQASVYTGEVMTQTINGLSAGAYKVTLEATASTTTSRDNISGAQTGDGLSAVFANNTNVNLPVVARLGINNDTEYGPYEVIGKVGDDGVLKYGIKNIATGGNWFVVNLLSIEKVEYVPVTEITVEDVEVEMGGTAEIGAVVTPESATFLEITYVSADEAVATVDAAGVVTGVAVGNTTITLTADDVTKTINVSVVAPAILPESITLEPASIDLQFGGVTTAKIIATVNPSEANQEVTFASSDESVATVDAEGNVTATGIGSAEITVTSAIKEDVIAAATVNVIGADAPVVYTTEIADGKDYWLINAATGKYLGGANNWGTRASLIEHGIPFKFIKTPEGAYQLDSYTTNGGASHFLALANGTDDPFIDQPAMDITFTPNDNGSFSLEVGENYIVANASNTALDKVPVASANINSPFAQWYVISLDDRLAMLENGDDTDATFFIKDFNFSRNNMMYPEWEWTFADPGNTNHDNAGDNANLCVESYRAAFNQTQTVVVPNGTYKLTAQGFYRNDGGTTLPVFFANDEEQTFPEKTGSENNMAAASVSFSAGLYKSDPIEVTVTDHILKIGAKCEDTGFWCIWDNFELELVEFSADQDVNVKIGPVGYATLYYGDLNLVAPEGVKVSTATVDGSSIILEDVEGVIPAGTGVVLQADPAPATATDYPFSVSYEAAPELSNSNQLQGTDEETEIAEAGFKYYVLSTKKGSNGDANTIGFYWQDEENEGSKVINGAHKAYLAVEESVAGDINGFVFDNATGIQTVEKATVINGEAYSLSGIRVDGSQLQKGIYIVNGKKIVIK